MSRTASRRPIVVRCWHRLCSRVIERGKLLRAYGIHRRTRCLHSSKRPGQLSFLDTTLQARSHRCRACAKLVGTVAPSSNCCSHMSSCKFFGVSNISVKHLRLRWNRVTTSQKTTVAFFVLSSGRDDNLFVPFASGPSTDEKAL